jgi:molybdopterin-containing oxidoreductase family iron-sulfur binding subunit
VPNGKDVREDHKMHYAMLIDLKRCMGCSNCAVTCKNANNLPAKIWWNYVHTEGGDHLDTPAGEFPNGLSMKFVPTSCQHCKNPPCVSVCPVDATYKREEDGIVMMDYEKCIGCKLCIEACPYGVRTFIEEEPSYYFDFALGDFDADQHIQNVVEKCNFCYKRLERGEDPACMELCPVRARVWGDLDDPESEVNKRSEGRTVLKLKENGGTEPSCSYLI